MRVSTSMVFDAGVRTINAQTSKLLHLQQQVATGRRIVTPADDPVAAARVLELTQASDVVTQFARNRESAQGSLAMEESQLTGVGELVTRVRELAVQGGNGSLTRENRRAITAELRARFEELMGYANARDGNGKYMFSGYMGDTRPFSGAVETAVQGGVTYQGDDGQRLLQVSPSRVLEISDSGKDIFQRIKNGNGTFVTDVNIANTGTAVIDGGAVTDPTRWNASPTHQAQINFYVDSTVQPPVTYYDLIDTDPASPGNGTSLLTGPGPLVAPSTNPGPPPVFSGAPGLRTYTSGQAIQFKSSPTEPNTFDLGSNVLINGAPGDGDSFTIEPSTTQDLFKTLATLIVDLEDATSNDAQHALLTNRIGFALTNLDQAEQNILRVRAQVGSRLQEVDSLQAINEDIQIQYQQSISNLQDLDYAKTISDLTRKQTDLQAAQQSFVQVSRLSLFNYL
ncbi:MAG: flagellar hook-associated protein FlgL [Rhodocyclaceae bacterium]|nr:flagellar hook-associated protein FlgL [Rhodocyclaceae bacterium]MDZ4215242.1 flagellar hook-associated protein FlgL [Rhodocyclaceae bacterium]